MPHPKVHEFIDNLIFGQTLPEIHKWIDGTFTGKNGRVHWINRHHSKAIDSKYRPSSLERKIARLHVLIDWLFYYNIVLIPNDADEVKKVLMQHGVYFNERHNRL